MAIVTRIALDVLKPHQPNALDFAGAIADLDPNYRVILLVQERDEKTESIILSVLGAVVDYQEIAQKIESMGGSVHSIDEVEVQGTPGE